MKVRSAVVMIVFLKVSILGLPSAVFGDAEEIARFKKEYPPAARRLEERFSQVRGSCRLQKASLPKYGPASIDEGEFAIDHGFEKVTIKRKSPDGGVSTFIYCIGEDNNFQLIRGTGSDEFFVESIGSTPSTRAGYHMLFGRFVMSHYGAGAVSLAGIMDAPGFQLLDAEQVTKGGRGLIKVDMEFGAEPKERVLVVFDPGSGWVIQSSEYRPGRAPEKRFLAEIEYGAQLDGFSLPRKVTLDNGSGKATCEFINWTFEPTPIEEFKMSYYGLPDLASGAGKSRNWLPYWLMGIAVAGVIIAIGLRRLGRRT